jgi:hypothetical protein
MWIRRYSHVIAIGVSLFAAPMVVGPAAAAPCFTAESNVEQEAREFLTQYGVDAATQDALVAALAAGERWDSFSGGVPTKVHPTSVGRGQGTVSTFADGSIVVQSIEKPQVGQATPFGVDQCVVQSSSNYHTTFDNCNIYTSSGVVGANFRANYTINNGGNASINSVWNPTYWYALGTSSDLKLNIARKVATASVPASARLSFQAFAVGAVGYTAWMDLYLKGSSAWTNYWW